jgi:hypothetical protein
MQWIGRVAYNSTRSKLDLNLEKVNSTPEGEQALEDSIVRWVEVWGRMPDDQELETITTLIIRNQSVAFRWYCRVMGLLLLALILWAALDAITN